MILKPVKRVMCSDDGTGDDWPLRRTQRPVICSSQKSKYPIKVVVERATVWPPPPEKGEGLFHLEVIVSSLEL